MLKAFAALEHWLQENNINPAGVEITLTADPIVAARIGDAVRRIRDDLTFKAGDPGPIREGELYGMRFRIVDKRL